MTIASHTKIRSPRQQVETAIEEMIVARSPGDRFPPGPELAKQLGVSRATLREVLGAFVERGALVRRHGVGTFVSSRIPVLESGLEVLESIDSLAQQIGLETEMADLEVLERTATPLEAQGLGTPAGKAALPVLIVNRVIAVAGEPIADLRDIVPLKYLRKEDLDQEFRGSILDLFLARSSPILSTSRTQIMVVSATAKFAQRLKVPLGSALLKLGAQLYSYDEEIVAYSVSYFVPGHFNFHVMRRVKQI
ncbi:MAG TPA: GntR family transcriptional regulator [Thermoflexia bacterium]|nr:GntR family transcriptional regulator [Thermoflexia bacterium]